MEIFETIILALITTITTANFIGIIIILKEIDIIKEKLKDKQQ